MVGCIYGLDNAVDVVFTKYHLIVMYNNHLPINQSLVVPRVSFVDSIM